MSEAEKKTGSGSAFFVCFIAALAGLLLGIDVGIIAQAKEFIRQDFNLSDTMISWVVGSMMGGAAIGAIGAGFLTKTLGRKKSLFISATMFLTGVLGCAAAWGGFSLIFFRLILGLSIGVASFTAPLYLSEVAPKSIRGTMITMYQLLITIGILSAFLSNSFIRAYTFTGEEGQIAGEYFFQSISISWRVMLGITVIPATIFLVGVILLPESPRWLIAKGRHEQALAVLRKNRKTEKEAQDEAQEIRDTVSGSKPQNGFKFFLGNKNFRKTVFLGVALQLMQQLTGLNVVMYYGPELIKQAGFTSPLASDIGTILFGLTNVLATFIAITFVDKWGRKPILIAGYILMALSMTLVALFMYLEWRISAVACILVFIISFAFSAGPIVWVICSEIQPIDGRDFGITCSTGANWISNMMIATTFLMLLEILGSTATMLIYAGFSLISIFVIYLFVPETKGISLEHLEKNLMKGVKLRDLGKNL